MRIFRGLKTLKYMHFALLEFIGVAIIYWRKAIGSYCSLANHIGKYSLEEIQLLLNKAKEKHFEYIG